MRMGSAMTDAMRSRISMISFITGALGLGLLSALMEVPPGWAFGILACYVVGGLPSVLLLNYRRHQRQDDGPKA